MVRMLLVLPALSRDPSSQTRALAILKRLLIEIAIMLVWYPTLSFTVEGDLVVAHSRCLRDETLTDVRQNRLALAFQGISKASATGANEKDLIAGANFDSAELARRYGSIHLGEPTKLLFALGADPHTTSRTRLAAEEATRLMFHAVYQCADGHLRCSYLQETPATQPPPVLTGASRVRVQGILPHEPGKFRLENFHRGIATVAP